MINDEEGLPSDISSRDETISEIRINRLQILMNDQITISAVDQFKHMWNAQEAFMRLLQQKRNFPEFPVDLTSKPGQRLIKEIIHDCQDELGEARILLKNTKNHRQTEIKEFDREGYVEECVDSFKFLLEILILSGISFDEFNAAFDAKTDINIDRIKNGY